MIAVFLQLAPVIHYWETLKCALKARKCKKSEDRVNERRYYLRMLQEDQDVALLRVFECFLEAAPQQILQLTLMLKHYHNEINFECISIPCGIYLCPIDLTYICKATTKISTIDNEEKNYFKE